MLVEAAIGDAYGAGFEYVSGGDLASRPNDLSQYYLHPYHPIGAGRYTDDTEMSTAVAEAMLHGPVELSPFDVSIILTKELLASLFVEAFNREQRHGYANRFYDFLKSTKSGTDFLANIRSDSDKSGAAMRGWVTGLYGNVKLVMAAAAQQARLTHDTPGGIQSAQAAALMTHFFAYDRDERHTVAQIVSYYVPGPWKEPRTQPVGSSGIDAVHAAIQAVTMHDKMSLILKQCIAFGGDVDTVATIALGAASWSPQIEQDLPQALTDGLEAGRWGKPYLTDLDNRLYAWMGKKPR